jgi:hypothetical protein
MKGSFLLSVVVAVAFFPGPVKASASSPKDVVEQFVKMDVGGARLTPQGWHDADALFVKASEPSQPAVLVVIGRRYAVSEATEKGATGESYFGYEEIGRIGASSLHFAYSRVEWYSFEKYKVVANSHRASGTDKENTQKLDSPSEWKIDGVQPAETYVTADVAIRYVTQMRDNATDPAVRKNADQALAKLSRFR